MFTLFVLTRIKRIHTIKISSKEIDANNAQIDAGNQKGCEHMAPPGRNLGPRGFLTDEEKQNMPKVNGALIRRILSCLVPN